MSKKKYWKSIGEKINSPTQQKIAQNEFQEKLPFDEEESLLDSNSSRRDFLKYLGFSTAAVSLAASCKTKVRHVIPYAIKPENIVPGVAQYFASTFVDGGDVIPVLVKNRDGRPIKIEGNPSSPVSQGAINARGLASVLNLYDTNRLRFPLIDGVKGKEASWENIDTNVKAALSAGKVAIVSPSISGPSNKEILNKFLASYPSAEHIVLDDSSYSGILDANEIGGKRQIPFYRFDKADTIVSIGADFLGSWVAPALFSRQYSIGRKVSESNPQMSKHIQIEATLSMTGANADNRWACRASEYGKVALALLDVLQGAAPNTGDQRLDKAVQYAAKNLKNGNGLVVCGSNDVAVQTVVNAINNALGAYGNTIDSSRGFSFKGSDEKLKQFAAQAKNYDTILFIDSNPVYKFGKVLADAISAVKNSIAITDRIDETAEVSKTLIPLSHFLESWGDAEIIDGAVSFIQPSIDPIFRSRTWQDCLLKWSGEAMDHADYFKNYWMSKAGGETAFNALLQAGVNNSEADLTPTGSGPSANVEGARAKINEIKSGKFDLVRYQKTSMGHGGHWSNNPWIQEMPDPITKCVWDNYIMMSQATAKSMNAELTDLNEVDPAKKVFQVKTDKGTLTLPVMVVPGMHDEVVAIAEGYGRSELVGMAAAGVGKNIYEIMPVGDHVMPAEVTPTDDKYDLAQIQTHLSYEGRPIIQEFTLEDFKKDPQALRRERYETLKPFIAEYPKKDAHGGGHETHGEEHTAENTGHGGHAHLHEYNKDVTIDNFEEKFRVNGTLYPNYQNERPGARWEMSIDLNSCIGCGACTIACQSENNVSVVGKEQVQLMHDMEWIRIDRYFSGDPMDPDSIETVFQPMLCQHCDNAPCENVCPVNATNHSSEGLNQMAYNRCIGTRYCANNCPYKVRRFNWRDWNGADSFKSNLYSDGQRDEINDDLTRMVLNPDVTVRSRGVMEKCSFCAQRLQAGKLAAKKENRPLVDSDVMVACQQGCPTNSIVFGNINDPKSEIYKLRNQEQKARVYYALEDIHVLPSINYLSKVRNTEVLQGGYLGDLSVKKPDDSHHGGGHEASHENPHGEEAHAENGGESQAH